jgi:hypothetical protein
MSLVGALSTGLLGPADVEEVGEAVPVDSLPDIDGFGYGEGRQGGAVQ